MRLGISLLFIFVFISGCSHSHHNDSSRAFWFDKSNIVSWSADLQRKEPCKVPFLAKYTIENKNLYFVAANHSEGPVKGNKTFEIINQVFGSHKLDFLVVEKIKSSDGISPNSITTEALNCRVNDFKNCTERQYAIALAYKNKIDYIGAEPDDRDIAEKLSSKYTLQDLVGYYWYVNLVRWKRRNQIDFQKVAEEEKTYLDLEQRFKYKMSFKEFIDWFEKTLQIKFSANEVTAENLAPLKGSINFLQNLAYDIDLIREPFILAQIENSLKSYDNVAVVYGAGHHVKQSAVFKKAFQQVDFQCY